LGHPSPLQQPIKTKLAREKTKELINEFGFTGIDDEARVSSRSLASTVVRLNTGLMLLFTHAGTNLSGTNPITVWNKIGN
jgi:hypothetical protein